MYMLVHLGARVYELCAVECRAAHLHSWMNEPLYFDRARCSPIVHCSTVRRVPCAITSAPLLRGNSLNGWVVAERLYESNGKSTPLEARAAACTLRASATPLLFASAAMNKAIA